LHVVRGDIPIGLENMGQECLGVTELGRRQVGAYHLTFFSESMAGHALARENRGSARRFASEFDRRRNLREGPGLRGLRSAEDRTRKRRNLSISMRDEQGPAPWLDVR